MYAGSMEAQQMWQQADPAYMQQMQAYAQMYNALGVAPDGTLLAAGMQGLIMPHSMTHAYDSTAASCQQWSGTRLLSAAAGLCQRTYMLS